MVRAATVRAALVLAIVLGAWLAGARPQARERTDARTSVRDAPIGADRRASESEPSVAINPRRRRRLIVGSHLLPAGDDALQRCVAYRSSDGGRTWSEPVAMPMLAQESYCNDPVVAYAPDGDRAYYAYMDRKGSDWDVVVSHSDDDGRTWTRPVVVFRSSADFYYDKPWIATHRDPDGAAWVYLTATRFDTTRGGCQIAFAGSGVRGVARSWRIRSVLASVARRCGEPMLVHGPRPAAGRGDDVLVAWYHSGHDGPRVGSFQIRTRLSRDHGRSWAPAAVAAHDAFEAPRDLGPRGRYHRWFAVMFPDVTLDARRRAHLVYTHDPDRNPSPDRSSTPEDGDIRYLTSPRPPYTRWSRPVTVNRGGPTAAQGFASVEAGGRPPRVHVLWVDHRRSPTATPNLLYDIYRAHKQTRGGRWSASVRVSDRSSRSDWIFTTDYTDLAAARDLLFGVWTDRRRKRSIRAVEDDVFGSRLGKTAALGR